MRNDDQVGKYDNLAESYSARYADPEAVARRQLQLVRHWGANIPAGASVLELGCADGFVTEYLVREGYDVTAVDFSPAMVDLCQKRLDRSGLTARVLVGDINEWVLDRDFDVVCAVMWTFFAYAGDAAACIAQLARHARRKLLLDIAPRSSNLRHALDLVERAGLSVDWRPLCLPQRVRLPGAAHVGLRALERFPGIRRVITHVRFNAVIKGEPPQPRA